MTRRVLALVVVALSLSLVVSTASVPLLSGDRIDDDVVLAPSTGPNGDYAVVGADGELDVLLTGDNPAVVGEGVPDDTVSPLADVFTITYTGDTAARVWITDDADDVRFFHGSNRESSLEGESNSVTLAPDQMVRVGLLVDTRGDHDVEQVGTFEVTAELATGSTPTPGDGSSDGGSDEPDDGGNSGGGLPPGPPSGGGGSGGGGGLPPAPPSDGDGESTPTVTPASTPTETLTRTATPTATDPSTSVPEETVTPNVTPTPTTAAGDGGSGGVSGGSQPTTEPPVATTEESTPDDGSDDPDRTDPAVSTTPPDDERGLLPVDVNPATVAVGLLGLGIIALLVVWRLLLRA